MLPNPLKKLKFRSKIFLICFIISLVPVSILGFFCYSQTHSLLIQRENDTLTESLNRETTALNTKIIEYETIITNILYNDDIRLALKHSYDTNYEKYILYRDTLDPFIKNMKSFNVNITNITIYSDLNLHNHGNIHRSLNEIKDTPWYSEVTSKHKLVWIFSQDEQTLSVIGQFTRLKKDTTALVKIDIDYQSVFSSLSGLYEQSYGILLTDSTDVPIYQFCSKDLAQYITLESILNASLSSDKRYIIHQNTVARNGWHIYLYRPSQIVTAPALTITKTVFIMIIFCLFCIILLSSALSSVVVRPLEQLTYNMQQLKDNNFEVTVTYDSPDEIGTLVRNFKSMAEHMNHLINEVLQNKILQQKYEMKALQAQINPHFLYNTLSLINSKAILIDQTEIGQVAQFLSTFYRTTLNKGKNIISVRDELNNVRSYINIQLIMHSNSFDVCYEVDEEMLSYTTINLILQPLVENAIMHGIDLIQKPERGLLKIKGYQFDNLLLFEISDNGPGIPASKLDSILHSKSTGYGVKNVQSRIQLFYGAKYGLSYKSTDGGGTTVILTIPKQLPDT